MNKYRTHKCNEINKSSVSLDVVLSGWLANKRDKGGIIFAVIRDHYGSIQITVQADESPEIFSLLSEIRLESTIRVEGKVIARPDNQINMEMSTGEIEVKITGLEKLGTSKVLPFPIIENPAVSEAIRMKYRFLDLRRKPLHENIVLRSKVISFIRQRMIDMGFIEIQTPILTVSSPEGARDYLVPSRVHPGKFYALPQAPQQFKQLLMTSGFDRYFQIAPCFRDEDGRADRSPGEFYQLDLEMAFVTQEDVFEAVEKLMIDTFQSFSDWKVPQPFPRIPYFEAMKKYGSDKPDLRFKLEIQDVTPILQDSQVEFISRIISAGGTARAIVVPNIAAQSRKFFEGLDTFVKQQGGGGMAWIAFSEDGSVKGSIAKKLTEQNIMDLKSLPESGLGIGVLIIADSNERHALLLAGRLRLEVGRILDLIEKDIYRFCWIVDYPMFEWNEETNSVDFSHNPFSMPQGGMKALEEKDPLEVLAWQYDIVCNGVELSSGAIRNHRTDIMIKAFEIAGYKREDVEKEFGGLFQAFQYGPPPHGGLAPGIDRIIMLLAQEPNIREVIPFPMNIKAQDLLMNAPSEVSKEQLDELHIRVVLPEEK